MRLYFGPNALIKSRAVKAHYRHLPNGSLVYIDQHQDKRDQAKKDPGTFAGKVIHSDDKSTTVMPKRWQSLRTKGKAVAPDVFKHKGEMNHDEKSRFLNGVYRPDEHAREIWQRSKGIKDYDAFLDEILEAEKESPTPRFRNELGADFWIYKNHVSKIAKHLNDTHGDVTTYAQAYTHKDPVLRDFFDDVASDPEMRGTHEQALGKLMGEHSEHAIEDVKRIFDEAGKVAHLGPKDCPHIPALSSSIKFFGHQAETLAKLDGLTNAMVDVDMGGGKGLILPADALNLMAKGKIKKPLIVVPTNTLDQNAKLTAEKYTEGRVNVFKMSAKTLKDDFKGDLEAMMQAMDEAPPNTIFMAGYDFVSYKPKGSDDYANAKRLSASGFDYVALDESHRIKTTETSRFKAVQHLSGIKYKRVASGTFISNNPLDAIGQLKFLHPYVNWTEKQFKEAYGHEGGAAKGLEGNAAFGAVVGGGKGNKGKGRGPKSVKWSRDGLKKLREDLQRMGLVSIRRSAWIDKLPQRNEHMSVVKHDATTQGVYETALDDVISQILEESGVGDESEDFLPSEGDAKPAFMSKFNVLMGITDHPDTLAETVEKAISTLGGTRAAARAIKAELRGDAAAELEAEKQEAIDLLSKLSPDTRKAIRALKGKVSPKATDLYAKLDEHFKDPKNGKFIVFCQRRMSAQHVLDHMPEHLKSKAIYYDASHKKELEDFQNDPKGPQIIVAVDQSVTEGVNLQIANGMYRYDHHYSPGTQEQSYARIWRFGQDKPVNIHLGLVDDTMDVTKYVRLMAKLHTNMMIVSDMDDTDTETAITLNLENIRGMRKSEILPKYHELGQKILQFQHEEGKAYAKKYTGEDGDPQYKRSTAAPIGGEQAQAMHGQPGYQQYAGGVVGSGTVEDSEKDGLLGHFRDHLRSRGKKDHHLLFDRGIEGSIMPHIVELASRHEAAKGKGKKVTDALFSSYVNEYEKKHKEKLTDGTKKAMRDTVDRWASGKAHTPHKDQDHESAVEAALNTHGIKSDAKIKKHMGEHLKDMVKHLGSRQLDHLGDGDVANPKEADSFWPALEKKLGEKASAKTKKVLLSAAAMFQENQRGYNGVRHHIEGDEE